MLLVLYIIINISCPRKRINKKCHKHVTNAPKGIDLAKDTFEES